MRQRVRSAARVLHDGLAVSAQRVGTVIVPEPTAVLEHPRSRLWPLHKASLIHRCRHWRLFLSRNLYHIFLILLLTTLLFFFAILFSSCPSQSRASSLEHTDRASRFRGVVCSPGSDILTSECGRYSARLYAGLWYVVVLFLGDLPASFAAFQGLAEALCVRAIEIPEK